MPLQNVQRLAGAAAAALAALSGAATAQAAPGLLGTEVGIRYEFFGSPTVESTVLVGAGVEMSCQNGSGIAACAYLTEGSQSVDIGADSFTYLLTDGAGSFTPLPTNGFTFFSLNPGYAIGGVALDTNIATMQIDRVSFTGDSVSVHMAGLAVGDGSYFTVTLQPVPEPAMAGLWAVGLLAVVGAVRRFRPV